MLRPFETILCPIDFSDAAYHALDYALHFARQSNARLILVHVLHNPADEFFHSSGHTLTWGEAKERAQSVLEEVKAKRLTDYPKAELIVEVGDPHEQIVKLSHEHKADMVVISTHGRSSLAHLVLGSVAEKIIRHASCPVFVVRRNLD